MRCTKKMSDALQEINFVMFIELKDCYMMMIERIYDIFNVIIV